MSGTAPLGAIRKWARARDFSLSIALLGVVAAGLLLLARGLPARTFFAGDSGVKLIVVRNAIEHPTHPLDIDLPRIDNKPVAFLDPFFHVEGGYAHAATPDLFPLISAPFIAQFGMRGAYVLPAVGYLLAIWAIAALGVALDERRSRTMLVFVAIACTPLLFYGLEFWEHTLAAGVAATGTALCVARRSRLSLVMSGVLLGIAVLLRPEAVWYVVAVFVGAPWLPHRLGFADLARVAGGAAAGFLPFAAASALYSGQLFGAHLTRNMSGVTANWWGTRIEYLGVWFVPHDTLWLVAGAAMLVGAVVANRTGRFIGVVRLVGVSFAAIVAIAAATRHFDRASIWNAAPALLAVLVIPAARVRHGQKFLFTAAALSVLFIALTAPSDGGAQWGPRYLSLAFIPLAILAADALTAAASSYSGAAIVAVLLASSLLIQRNAYKELQSAKRTYERVVQFVERDTTPGSYIVTDLWWFDQVTAALYPTRTVLFVDDAASAGKAYRLLPATSEVFVVRSEGESRDEVLGERVGTAPFVIERRSAIPERALTILRVRLRL